MVDPERDPSVEEQLVDAASAIEVLSRRVIELSAGMGRVQALARTATRAIELGMTPVWELSELERAVQETLWRPGAPRDGEAGW
jgi:hypothetical protein